VKSISSPFTSRSGAWCTRTTIGGGVMAGMLTERA
jgi:hypothetical protein